jgi:hypothetical protein
MFLKLTETGSGAPQFINMERVERLVAAVDGGSLLFYAAERCAAHVKEPPDEIVERMAEQAQQNQASSPAVYLRTFADAVNGIRDNVGAACRALAQGVQATGAHATGARATGAAATGARATGTPVTGAPARVLRQPASRHEGGAP